jgi:hypothetical protein
MELGLAAVAATHKDVAPSTCRRYYSSEKP